MHRRLTCAAICQSATFFNAPDQSVTRRLNESVLVAAISSPPLNALSIQVRAELLDAIRFAEINPP
jgi:hypothetical protein